MDIKNFSSLESTFLSKFNEGFRTFEDLKQNVPFDETVLKSIIEKMIAQNVIKLDSTKKEYIYDSPVDGDKVILDGNIMLPCTIIRKKDKLLVTRGLWYEFPVDFDIRRIIWNVQLPTSTKSTLVDLIKESVLKVRKSKIEQLPEYKKLVDILIPWNSNIMFKINTVGAENTDVSLIFKDKLKLDGNVDTEDFIEFRGFTTRSEIKTEQLIEQLTKSVDDRKFTDIEINSIYNFTDFIFAGNEIPISNDGETIEYAKITGIKNKLEITYYQLDTMGKLKKLNTESFIEISEGIAKLRELFDGYAKSLITKNDFLFETED